MYTSCTDNCIANCGTLWDVKQSRYLFESATLNLARRRGGPSRAMKTSVNPTV